MSMNVNLLTSDSLIPTRGTKNSAGLDLYSPIDFEIEGNGQYVIDLKLSIEIPDGYFGQIFDRSSVCRNSWVVVGAGTIDSDYRGSIAVVLFNLSKSKVKFTKGQRVAQLIILPYLSCEPKLADTLSTTDRGIQGFGSTGI